MAKLPSQDAINAYWRAWSLTKAPQGKSDSQEAHMNGLRAAYEVDFPESELDSELP